MKKTFPFCFGNKQTTQCTCIFKKKKKELAIVKRLYIEENYKVLEQTLSVQAAGLSLWRPSRLLIASW